MQKSHQQGFTLIELVIVIAMVGVITSFSVVISLGSLSKSTLSQERDLFVTLLLHSTRAASIANIEGTSHGVYIDDINHQFVLFNGTTYSSGAPSNRVIPYNSNTISVSNSGGNTIIFEQLSGSVTTGAGMITMTNGGSNQSIIIRDVGQIDW